MLIQILLGRGRAPTSAEKAKIFWFIRVHPRKKKQKSFGLSAYIRENPRPIGVPCGLNGKSLETTLVIKI
ncbi:MAG: hypothetical protein NTW32_10080 [Chloroflexi bacterium]|nr:hypothetical protein [Chloroflexota bacterium]